MNSTRNGAEGQEGPFTDLFERSETAEYFTAIEAIFLEVRGAPLTLNAKDYQLSRRWFEGVPLDLIRATVQEVVERRKREGKDTVMSLTYVKRAVERAWKRRQELLAPGAPAPVEPAFDVPALLATLAASLPQTLPDRGAWAARITGLGEDPEVAEEALARIDGELLQTVLDRLDGAQRGALEERLATAREKLARRLPAAEVERAGERLREQLLREQLELPVLSLFAVE